MAKKTERRHAVTVQVGIKSLTKAGTSIDLNIYAAKREISILAFGRGSIA